MTTVSIAPSRVLVLLVSVAVASFLLLASAVQATDSVRATTEVRVLQGDTLWAIASEVGDPGDDVRRIIHDIKRMNDLPNSTIRPGQVLVVPADG